MIDKRATEIIAGHLEVDISKVTRDAKFLDDLGADSLDTTELIMALEDEFKIEIPDHEAERLVTVGAVLDFLESKVGSA
jgi:acyl carrier protein